MRTLLIVLSLCIASMAYSQPKEAPQVDPKQQANEGVPNKRDSEPAPPATFSEALEAQKKKKADGSDNAAESASTGIKPGEWLVIVLTAGLVITNWLLVTGAQDTAQRQLRAYISVRVISVGRVALGQDGYARLMIKNHGQTPAEKLVVHSSIDVFPYPIPRGHVFPEAPVREGRNATLHPRQYLKGGASSNERFTPEQMTLIDAGKHRAYVFGVVKYLDAFNEPRTTNFCWSIKDDAGTPFLEPAPVHNDAT